MELPSLQQSLEHATLPVGPVHAPNYVFRCGPCDICEGSCLCRPGNELVNCLLTGQKPLGTFVYRSARQCRQMALKLQSKGLTCWTGRNRWRMHIVVASLHPDTDIAGLGTPRQLAMTQAFIDEEVSMEVAGAMFGYS